MSQPFWRATLGKINRCHNISQIKDKGFPGTESLCFLSHSKSGKRSNSEG
jgi:hypothetical protein